MTREDAMAQRMHVRQQSQSQIQIQKVQQITPPTGGGRIGQVSAVSVRKQADGTYAHEEQQHQAKLCPITGKILGQDDHVMSQHQQQQQHHMQSIVMNTQLLTSAGGEQHLSLQQQQDHTQQQQQQQQLHDIDPTLLLTNDQQMLTNEDGTPLLVTGEDGTVYQVAGKNAEGQTILVTQGPDGEQQFAYVAAAEGDENQVLTLDNAVAEAVARHPNELHQQNEAMQVLQYIVKTTKEDGTTHVVTMSEAELQQHQALVAAQQQHQHVDGGSGVATGGATSRQLCIQTSDGGDGQEANIPAEVILSFTIHSKPKIRKAAQHAIVSIIHGSSFMRPAKTDEGEATANFLIDLLLFLTHSKELSSSLLTLSKRYDTQSSLRIQIEHSIIAAIQAMGLENVLRTIPLTSSKGEVLLERSWLLPLLHEGAKGAAFKFFKEFILPLALDCNNKWHQYAQEKKQSNSVF